MPSPPPLPSLDRNPDAGPASPLRAPTPGSGVKRLPEVRRGSPRKGDGVRVDDEVTRVHRVLPGIAADEEVTRVGRGPAPLRPVFEDEEVTRVQKAPVRRTPKPRSESNVRARTVVDTSEAHTRVVGTPTRRGSIPKTVQEDEPKPVREASKKRLPPMPTMPSMTAKEFQVAYARSQERRVAEQEVVAAAAERARMERVDQAEKARLQETIRIVNERTARPAPAEVPRQKRAPLPALEKAPVRMAAPTPPAIEVRVERTTLGSAIDRVKSWFKNTFSRTKKGEVALPPGIKVADLEDLTDQLDS